MAAEREDDAREGTQLIAHACVDSCATVWAGTPVLATNEEKRAAETQNSESARSRVRRRRRVAEAGG